MKKFRKLAAILCAAAMLMSSVQLTAFAETEAPEAGEAAGNTDGTAEEAPAEETTESGYMFTLPDNMRASVITPTVDFFLSDYETPEETAEKLEEIFTEFAEIGLNTVIINTVCDDRAFYSIDMNSESSDPAALALSAAYSHGISPYMVLDVSHLLKDSGDIPSRIDALVSRVHRFTLKYPCDGFILDDYYVRRSIESFGGYMEDGSGIGYVNWLYDTAEQIFSTAADIIHSTNNSVAVGFMINDMWANSDVNELGSDTKDAVQALYDGHSDTKSFIEKGYVDFALLRCYGSMTDASLPFDKVTGWWGALAEENDIPMYVVHYNEKIGTQAAGWYAEDQLLRQLSAAKKLESYGGSVFNSYNRLTQDPMGTTKTLRSYYEGQINEETLSTDLKMVSPAKLNFTTSEPSVTFMGSFDSNFPVYFNNSPIKLNDAGNFYFTRDLKVGMNTFTVSHKSKTYTYKIERKIVVMKTIASAIAEGKSLQVDGGTKINLSVTAYQGSDVYGMVNGTKVKMSPSETKTDEEDVNSSYVRYTGKYTVPDGIIGQKQNLGTIKIYGSNSGYSMEVIGASVTVNALPEPVVEHTASMKDANSVGSGEVIGTLESVYKATDAVTYVKVSGDNTIVYDGKTADDIPTPVFSQLPAGTIEPYRATSGNYYITASGKRIAASASTLYEGTGIDKNALLVKSIGTTGGDSYIRIALEHRTGFNIKVVGNSYYTAWEGDYNVNSFAATHVYITFENVTSVTKLPSFENNMVFRSGKWDTVTEDNGTKFRLILELRQPGVYFGHGAKYNSEGDLMLTFKVPTNTLSGLTVVVDPGHGYGKTQTAIDPGATGEVIEQEVVLALAKELTSQLQAAGANAVRLKTENPTPFLLTRERPNVARGYGCDIYLSIHANKVLVPDPRGVEAYYFTSYSQPLAASISASLASYYSKYVYSDAANKNRGAKYSYYQVTLQQDFPSVLIEVGFVSNLQDAMALASSEHRQGLASAIVSGLKTYLQRSNISYAANGSSGVNNDEKADETAEETTAPEETAASEETTAPDTTTAPGETTASDKATAPAETSAPEETAASETTPSAWAAGTDNSAETSASEETAASDGTTDSSEGGAPEETSASPEETTSPPSVPWANGEIPPAN